MELVRTLKEGQLVECYRNLRTKNFSIRDNKTKLVVARGNGFLLSNVTCKVSESGRQRVVTSGQKNVHAFVQGIYEGEVDLNTATMTELYYNPFEYDSFINKATGKPIVKIRLVYFKDNKCWIPND